MNERLVMTTLGDVSMQLGEETLSGLSSRKAEALLVYLTVEKSVVHRRESLFTLLWPGMQESSARNNLRQVLFSLRQAIPEISTLNQDEEPISLLLADRQSVRVNPAAAVDLDIHRIDQFLDDVQVHDHLSLAGCDDCIQSLEQVISLYRGNFLANFYLEDSTEFEDWAEANRENYRGKALNTLEKLTDIFIQKGNYEEAGRYAEDQLKIDPLRESAYRQLMDLYLKSGQRTEALRTYQRCVRILDTELGTIPSRETNTLYEIISGEDLHQATATPREGTIRGYQIREHLGSGHTGMVYRAFQPVINRDVAVKVIAPQFANHPDFIRRFEVEAQLVARLEHPYIVPLYDYWRDPSGAYLVMRWLKGGSLQSALELGPWKLASAVQLVEHISDALTLAHRQGVVHCDIKPANILLDEDGHAYLGDFGIAILTGPLAQMSNYSSWGEVGTSSGSLGYASPEVTRGLETTPLADVYSLGVVIFELLCGTHPFPGIQGEALVQKHLSEALPSVLDIRPDLPETVDAVIQKATHKNPTQRYLNVDALASDFRMAITSESIVLPEISERKVITRNPYKGLRPFDEADSVDFFGRADLVSRLLGRLSPEDGSADLSRFLAVVGPSGCGKSSVVKAGLIPAIRDGAIPGSAGWFVVEMTPGSHPLEELETALLRIAIETPDDLLDQLTADRRGFVRLLRRALPGVENEVFLVIDQFEELFTLVEEEDDRNHFLDMLVTAVSDSHSPLRLVITLRADFYDRPLEHGEFGKLIRGATEVVLPLNHEELERAICGPAEGVDVTLEAALVTRIVGDVSDQPGMLPLLQYALTETFEHCKDHQLTLTAYEASGGVLGALGRRAEEIYTGLEKTEQEMARQLFLRLVTLGEGVEDTRRRVMLAEIYAVSGQISEGFDPVIDRYGRHRLLTFDHDPVTRAPTVEVAHEALLREWPRLRGWLDESRDDVRMERLLGVAAVEWETSGRETSYLIRGTRLAQFSQWAEESDIALSLNEQAYLTASLAALRDREAAEAERQAHETSLEKRSKRFLQALVGVFAIAMIIAVVLLIFAFNAQRTAQDEAEQRATAQVEAVNERDRAVEAEQDAQQQASIAQARELSQAAALNLENDPELAILLSQQAITAWQSADQEIPPDLEETLHRAVQSARALHTWEAEDVAIDIGFNSRTSHPYLILADTSSDTIRVWDPIQDEDIFRLNDANIAGETILADLSADGSLIAIPHADNVARIYNVATGDVVNELPTETPFLYGTVFSPDGRLLGAFGENYVGIWDLETGELALPPFTDPTVDMASFRMSFNADGSRVVWSSPTKIFGVFDTGSGEIVAELAVDYSSDVFGVALSPDGNRVAAGGFGNSLQVWDLREGKKAKPLNLWHNALTQVSIMFNPGGDQLAFVMQSGVMIWDLTRDEAILNLSGRLDSVRNLAYNQTGDQILTFSADGKVTLWDLSASRELQAIPVLDREITNGLFGGLNLALHPDGNQIAVSEIIMEAGDETGAIKVLDLSTGEQLLNLGTVEKGEYRFRIAYSPDGALLASTQSNGQLPIWDSHTGELLATLSDFGDERLNFPYDRGLHGLEFSPLCDTSPGGVCPLATAGTDGQAIIWDAITGKQILKYQNEDALTAIAFSPDGKQLAFGNAQWTHLQQGGVVKLMDVESGEILQEWSGIAGWTFALAFSPDGKRLALGTTFSDFRIMDVETGTQVHKLNATNGVLHAKFTPDGKKLLTTTGFDNLTTVWDAKTGERLYVLAKAEGAGYPNGLAISPDGSMVVVGMDRIYTYILDMEQLAALGQERLTRTFTLDECQKYLHLEQCPGE